MKRRTIREPVRSIPVAGSYDVCVAGGSATGVAAAVAAARCGARVILLERYGFLGGAATAGMVNCWHAMHDLTKKRKIIGGVTEEIIRKLEKRNAIDYHQVEWMTKGYYILDSEELKWVLDDLCIKARVELLLHSWIAGAVTRNGRIKAAVVENKSGRSAIEARVFVDATGDGDLAFHAGCSFEKARVLQPPTLMMSIHGWPSNVPHDHAQLRRFLYKKKYGRLLKPGSVFGEQLSNQPGFLRINGTRAFGADCTDARSLTAAELEGRRQAKAVLDILRKEVPGGRKLVLNQLATQIGVRETRRIRCMHRLTERELLTGHRFEDGIAQGTYPIDIHNARGRGLTMRHLDGVESTPSGTGRWLPEGRPTATFYQIPYRSLVPVDAKNLLVAGRCIGVDRNAFGAIRVMVNCNQTGQAAGVAAALAAAKKTSPQQLDPQAVRRALKKQNALVI